ncbi:MAG: hypothetical protein IJ468_04400 [Lachnospiraceae bacterium]|nr:hypothetical protein [Lachnospiraceae bacterium]
MKISVMGDAKRMTQVICNQCGKRLLTDRFGVVTEDYLHVEKTWGYFSKQDGKKISFDLCEDCAEAMFGTFAVPVYREEVTELI